MMMPDIFQISMALFKIIHIEISVPLKLLKIYIFFFKNGNTNINFEHQGRIYEIGQ